MQVFCRLQVARDQYAGHDPQYPLSSFFHLIAPMSEYRWLVLPRVVFGFCVRAAPGAGQISP